MHLLETRRSTFSNSVTSQLMLFTIDSNICGKLKKEAFNLSFFFSHLILTGGNADSREEVLDDQADQVSQTGRAHGDDKKFRAGE